MLSNSFKWKHYEGEIILLNVRWHLKYPLSYRNLKELWQKEEQKSIYNNHEIGTSIFT
jgi:transposase-like protein